MKLLMSVLVMCLCLVGCGEKSLEQRAEAGDAEAQSYLGYAYSNGEGVPKDLKEAVKWYRKAAEQGHAGAQTNLGNMYDDGEGVGKDIKEAIRWWRKAAEQGDAGGQNNLGGVYFFLAKV